MQRGLTSLWLTSACCWFIQNAESCSGYSEKCSGRRWLTASEVWRVVVHVSERDGDGRGPREPSHLADHVLRLDDQQVLVPCLAVHAGEGGPDDACGARRNMCPDQLLSLHSASFMKHGFRKGSVFQKDHGARSNMKKAASMIPASLQTLNP